MVGHPKSKFEKSLNRILLIRFDIGIYKNVKPSLRSTSITVAINMKV